MKDRVEKIIENLPPEDDIWSTRMMARCPECRTYQGMVNSEDWDAQAGLCKDCFEDYDYGRPTAKTVGVVFVITAFTVSAILIGLWYGGFFN